jgi:hypothetical protein
VALIGAAAALVLIRQKDFVDASQPAVDRTPVSPRETTPAFEHVA